MQVDLETIEQAFVQNLKSGNREELFQKYISYSEQLKSGLGNVRLLQWIDGSFATKKPEPRDFDLVTFIDYDTAKRHNKDLKDFKYPNSLSIFGIDGYIVLEYPRIMPIIHCILATGLIGWMFSIKQEEIGMG